MIDIIMNNNGEVDTSADVLYVVNKYIKWKNSARKSYIRKKIIANDMTCDITQLCYKLYDAIENKVVQINESQINIDNQRKLLQYEIEIEKLKEYKEKYENSHKQNIKKRNLLDDKDKEIEKLNKTITKLREDTNVKDNNNKDKSVFDEPVTEVEHNYNPYPECDKDGNPINKNEKIYIPTTLSDFSNTEISNAKYTYGIEFWDSLDDDLKIQCLLQLR